MRRLFSLLAVWAARAADASPGSATTNAMRRA
jgi:hypothetical protein